MSGTPPTRSACLALYKNVRRAGLQFKDFNFREYVVRRARERFEAGRAATGADAARLYEKGIEDLQVVRRQSTLNRMYAHGRNVAETM
ncbi:Complex 1 LYR protein domain-containing protein [Plasmodiophora brassicae]|uniref:Complex 1 LYR protein domain-containing protein n=1 Tax=Plasmodiophora brassicae TaxID=37360 RepID=A0A0G4IIG7_PLABS|nr:hypothetical protein PBRA_003690 [Plasmodiophora brassicae]SPQ94209.1 unnamed protein product [Plasmodiophora brassicae]